MLNYVRQFFKIMVVFHTLYLWNEDGDPNFFCISDTSNSLSDCSKNLLKIYRLEIFRANVLKRIRCNSWISRWLFLLQSFSLHWDTFVYLVQSNVLRGLLEVLWSLKFLQEVNYTLCSTATMYETYWNTASHIRRFLSLLFFWFFV